jgi:hypothetical protein
MTSRHHQYRDVIAIFDACFSASENTRLICGDIEPIYVPANTPSSEHGLSGFHRIIFAHGYVSSALHEVSHWSIAGAKRRLLQDYGYWYQPEGRCIDSQAEFAAVEARPQAIEWVFSKSCGKGFHVSLDNIALDLNDFDEFKDAIYTELQRLKTTGLPPRAAQFQQALHDFYQPQQGGDTTTAWQAFDFCRMELN